MPALTAATASHGAEEEAKREEAPKPPSPTRDQRDLIAQARFHPVEVTLRETASFHQPGNKGGKATFRLPPGKRVRLLSVSSNGLVLHAGGATAAVPFAATDFLERVAQERDLRHRERLANADQLRANVPQPHVQATLFQLRSGGPGMTRPHTELALDAFPWPADRVATSHLAKEVLAFIGLADVRVEQDFDASLLVTARNARRQRLELHWNGALPRNQFFVRCPQAADPQLAKGYSYEIPRDKPLLRRLTPAAPRIARSETRPTAPEPPFEPPPAAPELELAAEVLAQRKAAAPGGAPLALSDDQWDAALRRFNEGRLNLEETRQLLTRFEPITDAPSREELDDLIDWLRPENHHVREDEDGTTATLYFEKPYVFITARPGQDAYEFIVYPEGFWESQPLRFLYQRAWFNLPEP